MGALTHGSDRKFAKRPVRTEKHMGRCHLSLNKYKGLRRESVSLSAVICSGSITSVQLQLSLQTFPLPV
jgi:hypothetical protein